MPVPPSESTSALRRLALFFLVVIPGSALVAPFLFYLCKALHLGLPAHRIMDRAILICALATLPWLDLPWSKLWQPKGAFKQIVLGYAFALVSAQAMIGVALAAGAVSFAPVQHLGHTLAVAIPAALLVPFLEETLFRGFILHCLRDVLPRAWALILGALLFSMAHFLKAPADTSLHYVWDGFTAWGKIGACLGESAFFSYLGFNLFLIGLILGGLYLQTGHLWLNYGLHGGWILALFLSGTFLQTMEPAFFKFLSGPSFLASGYVSLVLLLLGFWLWRYFPALEQALSTGEPAR